MSDLTIIDPMTPDEARACLSAIRDRLYDARNQALAFKERRGWEALGYPSLAVCFQAELGYSFQHGYRLVAAAEIEAQLSNSPTGESLIGDAGLPERHARELAKLPTPEERIEAYSNAKQMASTERAAVATRHVEQSVKLLEAKRRVLGSPYFVIGQMMTLGEITPFVGVEMVEAVDKLPPRLRGEIMRLMAGPGLTCAALIAPLGNMIARGSSLVMDEVQRAGTLGGVPLKQATLTDLERASYEARLQHIAMSEEAQRQKRGAWQVEPETVNLALTFGDNRKLRRQLSILGDARLEALRQILMEA